MTEAERSFSLDELATLVDLPRRTVRYYIQIGLVDRPDGAGRGARYTTQHLDQLLEIRKWQQAGLSLERIGELLSTDPEAAAALPPAPRRPGDVEVRSHIVIGEGVELSIDPQRAQLAPEEVRALAKQVVAIFEGIGKDKE